MRSSERACTEQSVGVLMNAAQQNYTQYTYAPYTAVCGHGQLSSTSASSLSPQPRGLHRPAGHTAVRSASRYRRRTDTGVSTQQRCLTSCHPLTQRTPTDTQTVPVCSRRSRSAAFSHSKRRSELLARLSVLCDCVELPEEIQCH